MNIVYILLVFSLALAHAAPKAPRDALDEDFGYVDVREGAHMFWVTYHTELEGDWSEHPLILWLQGGPGSSGVGYGNFQELGPYDTSGALRDGRWTKKANVMFVDNPVGTGYSYVDDLSLLTKTNQEIADDLVTLLKSVFTDHPDMQKMPFFIYAESYGGKMTVDTAITLNKAIAAGEIVCNFQGISLGDSWISPIDSVTTWASYLYSMGFVNEEEQDRIDEAAARTKTLVDEEDWEHATSAWGNTESVILSETGGINFYNVHVTEDIYRSLSADDKLDYASSSLYGLFQRHVRASDVIDSFMNGPQKDKWNIPADVTFGSQSYAVFDHLSADFMKPVISSVEQLLEENKIHVTVFTGNLDLICDTPGTYQWIQSMNWTGLSRFDETRRVSMYVPEYSSISGYSQRYYNFAVITYLRSGHMVPIDTPYGALDMLDLNERWGSEIAEINAKKPVISKIAQVAVAKVDEIKKAVQANEAEPIEDSSEKKKLEAVQRSVIPKIIRNVKAKVADVKKDSSKSIVKVEVEAEATQAEQSQVNIKVPTKSIIETTADKTNLKDMKIVPEAKKPETKTDQVKKHLQENKEETKLEADTQQEKKTHIGTQKTTIKEIQKEQKVEHNTDPTHVHPEVQNLHDKLAAQKNENKLASPIAKKEDAENTESSKPKSDSAKPVEVLQKAVLNHPQAASKVKAAVHKHRVAKHHTLTHHSQRQHN